MVLWKSVAVALAAVPRGGDRDRLPTRTAGALPTAGEQHPPPDGRGSFHGRLSGLYWGAAGGGVAAARRRRFCGRARDPAPSVTFLARPRSPLQDGSVASTRQQVILTGRHCRRAVENYMPVHTATLKERDFELGNRSLRIQSRVGQLYRPKRRDPLLQGGHLIGPAWSHAGLGFRAHVFGPEPSAEGTHSDARLPAHVQSTTSLGVATGPRSCG